MRATGTDLDAKPNADETMESDALDRGGPDLRSWLGWTAGYAAAVGGAFLLAGVLVLVIGGSPLEVARALVVGSFGSRTAVGETLNQAAPLLIVALGTAVAFRTGLFNIGQEGQFLFGGLFAVAVALKLSAPAGLLVVGAFIAAALGGGAWAGMAALLRYHRGIHEALSTLLLTFMSYPLLSLAVSRQSLLQMEGQIGTGVLAPRTDILPAELRLPTLAGVTGIPAHVGILLGILLAVLVALVLARTNPGYRMQLLANNERLALRYGVRPALLGTLALMASGALVGVAGAVKVLGSLFQVQDGFVNDFGWDGLLIALIARQQPLAAIPVAIFWGALHSGGGLLVAIGVSRDFSHAVKGLLVLALLIPPAIHHWRGRGG